MLEISKYVTKRIMVSLIAVACFSLSFASSSSLAEGDKCGEEHVTDKDVLLLKNTKALINCVDGDTNQPSPQWKAFKKFYMVGKLASRSIDDILKNGSPAGKLYALILLKRLDKKRAEDKLKTLSDSKEKVEYVFECQAEYTTLGALSKRILKGEQLVKFPK